MAVKRKTSKLKPKPARVSHAALAWSHSAQRQHSDPFKLQNAQAHFTVAQHPPELMQALKANNGMAMDEADIGLTGPLGWAAQTLGDVWREGLSFLGYPYLAALAQRAEYRRLSETIASDMTRKWVKIKKKGEADPSERKLDKRLSKKIARIEAEFTRLNVRDVFRKAAEQDGFFGRGHIYIDTGDTNQRAELKTSIGDGTTELSQNKVNKSHPILRLRAVEAVWCYPLQYNTNDPLDPTWYKPQAWFALGKEIHASRFLTLVGREVADILKAAYSFGGLSLSQIAKPYVDNWLRTRQSVSDLLHRFSIIALKSNLDTMLQESTAADLQSRIEFFVNTRDNNGLMLLNKDSEELQVLSVPLGSLPELQAQTQEHMAAVSGIPLVKLLGIQPQGLNASSEGEIRVYYDWIAASQESLFRQPLETIFRLVQLSLFGAVDDNLVIDFVSLWALSETEAATVRKTEAETDAILVNDIGALSPEEVRGRVANDPETPYAGLDPDDVPEPPENELDITGALQSEQKNAA